MLMGQVQTAVRDVVGSEGRMAKAQAAPMPCGDRASLIRENSAYNRGQMVELVNRLKGGPPSNGGIEVPFRSGLDGVLEDTFEVQEHMSELIKELRVYLLG